MENPCFTIEVKDSDKPIKIYLDGKVEGIDNIGYMKNGIVTYVHSLLARIHQLESQPGTEEHPTACITVSYTDITGTACVFNYHIFEGPRYISEGNERRLGLVTHAARDYAARVDGDVTKCQITLFDSRNKAVKHSDVDFGEKA